MSKEKRLYTVEEGAYMTRLAVSSFRVKAGKLGVRGKRQGNKVFFTHKQIEDVFNGVGAKGKTVAKTKQASKNAARKTPKKAGKRKS